MRLRPYYPGTHKGRPYYPGTHKGRPYYLGAHKGRPYYPGTHKGRPYYLRPGRPHNYQQSLVLSQIEKLLGFGLGGDFALVRRLFLSVFGLVIDGRQYDAPRHFIHQFAPRPNALRGDLKQCAERAMGAFVP